MAPVADPRATAEEELAATPELDWGLRAQKAGEAHLDACEEARYQLECESVPGEDVDDPAIGPFCGCTTCIVREVLHATVPVLRQAFENGA